MALTNSYVLAHKRLKDVFDKIRDGQAPDRVSNQLLKDWDFKSTNDRAFIPLLKSLGFLTADGIPTQRYHNYRDHSKSHAVLGEALKEAYSDIFLIKQHPTSSDRKSIEGKFKSFHNASDNVADKMAKTFFELVSLADLTADIELSDSNDIPEEVEDTGGNGSGSPVTAAQPQYHIPSNKVSGLHYNIQIHLPATKDIEVYNSIFKSLKEHLLEE